MALFIIDLWGDEEEIKRYDEEIEKPVQPSPGDFVRETPQLEIVPIEQPKPEPTRYPGS